MHMADALLSPVVGGALWTVTAATIARCSSKVRRELDERKVPLMGVLGAFVFAAQMINFAIPATGSSGHLGGGLLLAILLGPHAALLTIASVLFVQALFFADGGLLALGCNIFNLGVFPAFVAYPFIYRNLVGREPSQARLIVATVIAAVVGLQLGSLAVVMETVASGISALPFGAFVLLMQPIHLAIGVVEGLATAAVVSFVWRARPEILSSARDARPIGVVPLKALLAGFLAAALLTGGVVAWFASDLPDGLEWSIEQVAGPDGLPVVDYEIHAVLTALQEKFAFLPDYAPRVAEGDTAGDARIGTSAAGLVGGLLTLVFCAVIGYFLKRRAQRR